MWKTFHKIVPNDLNLAFYVTSRQGPMVKRPPINYTTSRATQSLRNNHYSVKAAQLFNILPKKLKEIETLAKFKSAVDHYIQQIPDQPPVKNYVRANDNSILDWLSSGTRPNMVVPASMKEDTAISSKRSDY